MTSVAIADASCLIALHQITALDMSSLKNRVFRLSGKNYQSGSCVKTRFLTFQSIYVPPAVMQEIRTVRPRPDWVIVQPLQQPLSADVLRASLGAGESQVIGLAIELTLTKRDMVVILDDLPARRLAEGLGLFVLGTLGILMLAKRRGVISVLRPLLDLLRNHDFRIADNLYEQVLKSSGEW